MTHIAPKRRKKAATVHVGGKDKFPIDSAQTASSAIKLIHHAKPPLTSSQEATVRRKAAKYGAKSSPDSKKGEK